MPPRRRKVLTPAKRAPGPVAWPDHSRSTPKAIPASPATARRAAVSSSVTDPLRSDRDREDRARGALQQVPAHVTGSELAGGTAAPDTQHHRIRRDFLQRAEHLPNRRPAPDLEHAGTLEDAESAERVGDATGEGVRPEAIEVAAGGILGKDQQGRRLRSGRRHEFRRGGEHAEPAAGPVERDEDPSDPGGSPRHEERGAMPAPDRS